MKKVSRLWLLLSLFVTCGSVLLTSCSKEDIPASVTPQPSGKTYATLREALGELGIVDSISPRHQPELDADFREHYITFFTQPVDHQHPEGAKFRQKVVFNFRGFDRPTIMCTEGYYFDGMTADEGQPLGKALQANVIYVEHRNFGESMTSTGEPDWRYESPEQEAADLHAVFTALKPLLKGKWMSHGVSKNGETSIGYNSLYPNDMDLVSAFCSPLLTSLNNVRCGKYMQEESGTAEERATMRAGIRRYLADGEQGLYRVFCDSLAQKGVKQPNYSLYVFNVFEVYFSAFSYFTGADRARALAYADEPVPVLYKKWEQLYQMNLDPQFRTYIIDGFKWQGFYMNDFVPYYDLLEGTSFTTDVAVQAFTASDASIVAQYDESFHRRLLDEYLPTTTKPMLLVYSKDDPWTGARPERTNPLNTKLIINPNGRHSDELDSLNYYTPELRQEIVDFVKQYVY